MTDTMVETRRSLHGVAEYLVAGPQYRASGELALRVRPGGFATTAGPQLQVDADHLVVSGARYRLGGTYAAMGALVGVEPVSLAEVYRGGPGISVDDDIRVDVPALNAIMGALTAGDAALRDFDPLQTPILWPEHFDVAITADAVTYGVSPGDEVIPVPYAYVAPHASRAGDFWNQPFGAAAAVSDLRDAGSIAAWLRTGRERAARDAVRD